MDLDLSLAEGLLRLAQQHQSVELELAARLVDLAFRRSRWDRRLRWESLTARQQQVALMLFEGHSDRQIAAKLFISRETVRTHLRRAMHQMEVSSRRELRNLIRSAEIEDEYIQVNPHPAPSGAAASQAIKADGEAN